MVEIGVVIFMEWLFAFDSGFYILIEILVF